MNNLAYIISSIIWIVFIIHWKISSIPKNRIFEVYAGCSISICLTLTIFGLFGWYQNITSILSQIIGSFLIVIAVIIALFSLINLKIKGKPKMGIEDTTILINNSIFHFIRHPLYTGFIIWGVSQILIIQSIYSLIFGVLAILFSYLAAVKEDEYNIDKFGNKYKDYMNKVPLIFPFFKLKK